jgi:hypothetical protein
MCTAAANYVPPLPSPHHSRNNRIYVPPIIFDRNAHLVPHLVRVADLFWAGAGLSGHYRTSTICPLMSVYSLPLSLVDLVRGSGCIGICANVDSS